jgi:hypothetical protein
LNRFQKKTIPLFSSSGKKDREKNHRVLKVSGGQQKYPECTGTGFAVLWASSAGAVHRETYLV